MNLRARHRYQALRGRGRQAGHIFYRQPDQWLLGVIGQYGSDTYHPFDAGIDDYYVGGEGQAYFGNFTIYGQGGYVQASVENIDFDGYFAGAQARYFILPDWKLQGSVGYNKISYDGFDLKTFSVGAETEYRFTPTPVSIFAG